jgi:hypothetical protein
MKPDGGVEGQLQVFLTSGGDAGYISLTSTGRFTLGAKPPPAPFVCNLVGPKAGPKAS